MYSIKHLTCWCKANNKLIQMTILTFTNWNLDEAPVVRTNIDAWYWWPRVVLLPLIRTVVSSAVVFSTLILFLQPIEIAYNTVHRAQPPPALLFQMNKRHQLVCQIYWCLLHCVTARVMSTAVLFYVCVTSVRNPYTIRYKASTQNSYVMFVNAQCEWNKHKH